MKSIKSSGSEYFEIATRGTQTLAISLENEFKELDFFKRLRLRFIVVSSDGNFGEFHHLSLREPGVFQNENGKTCGIRLNKITIPVSNTRLTPFQFMKFCDENYIIKNIADFIVEVVNKEGFSFFPEFYGSDLANFLNKLLFGEIKKEEIPENLYKTPVLEKKDTLSMVDILDRIEKGKKYLAEKSYSKDTY